MVSSVIWLSFYLDKGENGRLDSPKHSATFAPINNKLTPGKKQRTKMPGGIGL